jgi:hypothetical protein
VNPRPALTENQRRQLLALLERGAIGMRNSTPETFMSFYSADVLEILKRRDGLVGMMGAHLGSPLCGWFLTPEGESEARQLVRELAHG